MLRFDDMPQLAHLLIRLGLCPWRIADGAPIPGSFWGAPEAGLIQNRLYFRQDTPVHSALHEACHYVCMDDARRAALHTDAGGDHDEENAVCYLQITLATRLPDIDRARICADMDAWGYSFRLGSARTWYEQDAADARAWLMKRGVLRPDGEPSWKLRR